MMNEVIHVRAKRVTLFESKKNQVAARESPVGAEVGLFGARQRGSGFAHVFVEHREQRFRFFERVLRRSGEVHHIIGYSVAYPVGDPGDELREMPERKRFRMWLPRALVARNALQKPPRRPHLVFEFRKKLVLNVHWSGC